MKRGIWSAPGWASVIAAAGIVLGASAACGGGGGGLTLEEYFTKLDTIFRDTNSQLDSINANFDSAYQQAGSDEEAVSVFLDYVSQSRAVTTDARAQLEGLEPPSEAKDAHEAFTAAVSDKAEVTDDLAGALQGAQTTDDINSVYQDFAEEGQAANDASNAACLDLQAIADGNNIDVDLKCEET